MKKKIIALPVLLLASVFIIHIISATTVTFTTDDVESISITALDTDTFVVAWCDETSDSIKFKIYDADGTQVVSETTVDTSISSCDYESVDVSAFNSTMFVIGYMDSDDYDASFKVYNSSGNNLTGEIDVDESVGSLFLESYAMDVSTLNSTNFVFAYFDNTGANWQYIYAYVYDYVGNLQYGGKVSDCDGDDCAIVTTIATTAFNDTAWAVGWNDDSSDDITFDTYNVDTVVADEIDISQIGGDSGASVDFAAINDTHFVAVYLDKSNPFSHDVSFQIFDYNGNVVKAETDIDTSVKSESRVGVSMINKTHFVVTYSDSDGSFKYAIYDNLGNLITSPTSISTTTNTIWSEVESQRNATGIGFCSDAFVTLTVLNETHAEWNSFYPNGTAWNGECTILYDIPNWQDNASSIPSSYENTASEFNITWSGNEIDTVFIEINCSNTTTNIIPATNYSMSLLSGNNISGIYNFSIVLPASNCTWTTYANDTGNDLNTSDTISFEISKATPSLNLSSNNVTYSSNISIDANEPNTEDVGCLYMLWIDNVNVENGSSISYTDKYGVANYTIKYNTTGCANYTSSSNTTTMQVYKGTLTSQVYINGTTSDQGRNKGEIVNLTGIVTGSDYGLTVYLSIDHPGYGDNFTNDTDSDIENITSFDTAGTYTLRFDFYGDQNWTATSSSIELQILQAGSPTYSNITTEYSTPTTYNFSRISQMFNVTFSWDSSITNLSTVIIDFNGTNYTVTSNRSIDANNAEFYFNKTGSLKAGNYTYIWYANNTDGNMTTLPKQNYTVNRADPTNRMSLTSSQGWVMYQGSETTITGSETNDGDTDCTYSLAMDGNVKTNPYTQNLPVGSYTFNYSVNGCGNYTSGELTNDLSVLMAPFSGGGGGSPVIETVFIDGGNWTTTTPSFYLVMAPLSSIEEDIIIDNKEDEEITTIDIECIPPPCVTQGCIDLCNYVTFPTIINGTDMAIPPGQRGEVAFIIDLTEEYTTAKNITEVPTGTYSFSIAVTISNTTIPIPVDVVVLPWLEYIGGGINWLTGSTMILPGIVIPNWLISIVGVILLIVGGAFIFNFMFRKPKKKVRFYV